jgi:hypothetical protein
MSHKHLINAGDAGSFYRPRFFISKAFVDAVGRHVDEMRKRKPKQFISDVPVQALDACKESYRAAKGDEDKSDSDMFDDRGIMALICRHDIPLFVANIDTAGEQQKYALALIIHLFQYLPPKTNVMCLYDIGCVLDTSVYKVRDI